MSKGGSRKGNPYENEMCKEISWWWTWGAEDWYVERAAASGGKATERAKKGMITKYQHGDLCPAHPDIYPLFDFFLFETKRGYNNIDILELLDLPSHMKKVPEIVNWFEKGERDRKAGDRKEYIILWKRDRREKLVIIPDRFIESAYILLGIGYPMFNHILVRDHCICLMADFFNYLEPEHIPVLLKRY